MQRERRGGTLPYSDQESSCLSQFRYCSSGAAKRQNGMITQSDSQRPFSWPPTRRARVSSRANATTNSWRHGRRSSATCRLPTGRVGLDRCCRAGVCETLVVRLAAWIVERLPSPTAAWAITVPVLWKSRDGPRNAPASSTLPLAARSAIIEGPGRDRPPRWPSENRMLAEDLRSSPWRSSQRTENHFSFSQITLSPSPAKQPLGLVTP